MGSQSAAIFACYDVFVFTALPGDCDNWSRAHNSITIAAYFNLYRFATRPDWRASQRDKNRNDCMTTSLTTAFAAASPRITPRPMPLISFLIYLAVLALWALLFARSFWLNNVWAWSAGIVYILYDTILMAIVVWQTLPLRAAVASPHAAMSIPKRASIGILIAAHNETFNLPLALAALARQTDPADLILIADDGSSDGTADLLRNDSGLPVPALGTMSAPSRSHATLRWLRLPHQGKARTLNDAITQVETDIVVTLDADTFLHDDAVAELRGAFMADPHLVAGGGVLIPVCDKTVGGRVMEWFQTYEYIRNFVSRFAWMRSNSLLLISGAFAGFRREPLIAVGGFDQDCLVEDYELTHRMHRYSVDHGLQWRLQMVATAVAETEAPSDLATFMRQRRRWFAGFLQTQYWNRDMTGNVRYGALGTQMLPIKSLDTLQPIYGLTAFVLLLALLITGKFAIAIPVFGFIAAKIVADFMVYMWTIHIYQRATRGRTTANFRAAVFAAILEPFSFQLLRHAGAAWGWIAFLRGNNEWGFRRPSARQPAPTAGE
jgi:cellulose synthase/poly-beta-1,6-N-acetylglucosamine synthase-like glycosyltransferase